MDPDGGSLLNAIQVHCRKERRSTCISARTAKFDTKAYVTDASQKHHMAAKHMGTDQVGVSLSPSAICCGSRGRTSDALYMSEERCSDRSIVIAKATKYVLCCLL